MMHRFESEFKPVVTLRLKIETNCREHFSILGLQQFPFAISSPWYTGECFVTTYKLEELLGTKLRALHQRRKGRDLFDIYKALTQIPNLNIDALIQCYKEYMKFVVTQPPTQKMYLQNMPAKMQDDECSGYITALIRPTEIYDQQKAYELVKTKIIERI